jgi:hypothetical protein
MRLKRFMAEIEVYRSEMAAIRRKMKATDAEIRRLELSTRATLDRIRSNLYSVNKDVNRPL